MVRYDVRGTVAKSKDRNTAEFSRARSREFWRLEIALFVLISDKCEGEGNIYFIFGMNHESNILNSTS